MTNKKSTPQVSIIVPVYKVEKYIRRSLDSLVNQTLENIEIICINDGSPDNCLSILKEYQEQYPGKIVIIDKQNEWVRKGRFDWIKKATWEYIWFVDSDDYVTLDFAEKLYLNAKENNSDMSVGGFFRVDTDTEHVFSKEMTSFWGKKIDMNINPEDTLSINAALWNKLFKSEVLKNIEILENPPRILDDMMFLLLAYLNVNKISFIKDPIYYYMVRSDSIISQIKKEQIESTENAMVNVKKIYEKSEKWRSLIEVLNSMAFLHFWISLMFRLSLDKDFKSIVKENRKYLDREFSWWRNSKYLKLSYSMSHWFSNFKLTVVKKIDELWMFIIFMKFYNFVLKTLKIDIKW